MGGRNEECQKEEKQMDGGSFGISNGPEYPPWYREERDVCPGIVMVICCMECPLV